MAHKTEASGEYPWPPEVASIIYDYYFEAPEILTADTQFYALCVDGTLYRYHPYADHDPFYRYIDIKSIQSNGLCCVAITHSGDILRWGDVYAAARLDLRAQTAINELRARGAYPTSVYHAPGTFAVLFSNGDQVFWGDTRQWQPNLDKLDLSKVDTLDANNSWFAALMKDKTVQTWMSNHAEPEHQTEIDSKELKGVVRIYSTGGAFAALRNDGTVVTWGYTAAGGDSSDVKGRLGGVKDIFTTECAFAALKEDGTVVTWGAPCHGGDSSGVSARLEQVEEICATTCVFAARCRNGSLVTWGDEDVMRSIVELPPVLDIYSTINHFGARTLDNQFMTWGHPNDCDIEFPLGSQHVTHIYSTGDAFAVTDDGLGVSSLPLTCVVSRGRGASFLATIDTGDVLVWGDIECEYADIINEHQMSIRAAFKNATGMR